MDDVRDSLTKQEQIILADFWENKQLLHVFQNVLSQRQLKLAIDTMATAQGWENVVLNRGEISGYKWINTFLKNNFEKVKKSRESAQQ